ncbi:hypothetical protein San01_26190 [Streptomyces angustmyceticus]|uniref:Uncharacterized protein n=1 Tax=Streptomyces angustmyceticus TaxID=285578 RepID=A0A5J4LDA9_9ACTN|nr:hypothetical protein San01_26190 [Streptomyces angustmyceticus]
MADGAALADFAADGAVNAALAAPGADAAPLSRKARTTSRAVADMRHRRGTDIPVAEVSLRIIAPRGSSTRFHPALTVQHPGFGRDNEK